MGLLKTWRQKSTLWSSINQNYGLLKRRIRIAKLPTKQFQQYNIMCQDYRCAQLSCGLDSIPNFSERPLNKYLHRSWNGKQKLTTAMSTLELIEKSFKPEAIEALFSQQSNGLTLANIELKSGEFAQLKLTYSHFPREGDLSIHLLNEEGKEIYLISFSFGAERQLYLCSLQGPATEDSTELVKIITKQTHGLRPKNLLMSAVYSVAAFFGTTEILGISNQAHIKSQHLKSSYDNFWAECGAELTKTGWFKLPSQEPTRDIELVKSQHRSAFRKREALRETMSQNIQNTLCLETFDACRCSNVETQKVA